MWTSSLLNGASIHTSRMTWKDWAVAFVAWSVAVKGTVPLKG